MSGAWKASMEHNARFNRLVNNDIYRILSGVTDKALSRDRGSWFGSLIGLLNHILVTDIHWLDRFRPLEPNARVFTDGRFESFSLEWKPVSDQLEVLAEGRKVFDDLLIEWFEDLPETRYPEALSYLDSGGGTHTTTAATAFNFLFTHQNYHRGQISQVLDELGVPHSWADNAGFEQLKLD